MQVTIPMPLVNRILTYVRSTGSQLTQRLQPLTSGSGRQVGPPAPQPVPVVPPPTAPVKPVLTPWWDEYLDGYACGQVKDLGFTAFNYADPSNGMEVYFGDIAIAYLGTARDPGAVAAAEAAGAPFESVIADRTLIEFATPELTAVLELQMAADHAAVHHEPFLGQVYEAIVSVGWRPCEIDVQGRVVFPETGPRLGRTWSLDKLLCAYPPVRSGPAYYAIPIKVGSGRRRSWSRHWALRRGSEDKRLKYLVAEVNPDEKRVNAVKVKNLL
jgi:hypothetical protein